MNVRIVSPTTLPEAERLVRAVGADPYAVPLMARKALMRAVQCGSVDTRAANLLKQEMLAIGGEAAVSRSVSLFKRGTTDVLLLGTRKHFEHLLPKLQTQPFGLKALSADIELALDRYDTDIWRLKVGSLTLELGRRTLVMGVLNVTPDSFSDGGAYFSLEEAVRRGIAIEQEGAAVIDIGGESTRPGARQVSAKEEIARVVPVIAKLSKMVRIPLSIDTYKPEVAAAAVSAGAALINDVTGLRADGGRMAGVAAKTKVPVIIMHMRGTPRTMQKEPVYRDVVEDIGDFLAGRMAFAREQGIPEERILLDPGIGFGKTIEHNCEILRRLPEFRTLGRPLVIGASRKKFIGAIAGGAPAERLEGSLAAHAGAALKGAAIVRAHDVAATAKALAVIDAIRGSHGIH